MRWADHVIGVKEGNNEQKIAVEKLMRDLAWVGEVC
jgi:hypothetical protein